MRLITHVVFNAGFLALPATLLVHSNDALTSALLVSVLSNSIIDAVGHEYRHGFIRRTPVSHTVPRSILWSLVPAVPMASYWSLSKPLLSLVVILQGLLSGPLHMLLDSLTERGIYVRRGDRWVRFAIAHFHYNNPAINLLFTLLGIVMLWISLNSSPGVPLNYHGGLVEFPQ